MVREEFYLVSGEDFTEHRCPVCNYPFTTGIRRQGYWDLSPGWRLLPHCSNSRCRMEASNEKNPYMDCILGKLLQEKAPLALHVAAWYLGLFGTYYLDRDGSSFWGVNFKDIAESGYFGYGNATVLDLTRGKQEILFADAILPLLKWGWVPREDGLWVKAPDPVGAAKSWHWEELRTYKEPLAGEYLQVGEVVHDAVKKYLLKKGIPAWPQDGTLLTNRHGLFSGSNLCLQVSIRTIAYRISSGAGESGAAFLPYKYDITRLDGMPVLSWKGISPAVVLHYGETQRLVEVPIWQNVRTAGPNVTFWGPDGDVQGEIYLSEHGGLCRYDGPALWVKDKDGVLLAVYSRDGYLHREDGPAVREASPGAPLCFREVYVLEGRAMTEAEWRRAAALRRLSRSAQQGRKLSL